MPPPPPPPRPRHVRAGPQPPPARRESNSGKQVREEASARYCAVLLIASSPIAKLKTCSAAGSWLLHFGCMSPKRRGRPLEVLGQSTAKMSYMCVSVFSYMYASVSSGCPWWQPNSQDPGQDPPRIPGGSSTKSQDPCVSSTAKIGGSSETTSPYIILLKGMT